MKRVISLLAMFFMLVPLVCYGAAEAGIDTTTGNIIIEGKINEVNVDAKGVSVLLKKKNAQEADADFVGYVNQFPVQADGSYTCKFKFTKDIDNYELLVYNGDKGITDTVTTAKYTRSCLSAAELTFDAAAGVATLRAELTNDEFADAFSCVAIIAGYDSIGNLAHIDVSEPQSFSYDRVETAVVTAEIPGNVQQVKGFVWKDLVTMIPLSGVAQKNEIVAYSWSLPQAGADNVYPMFYLYDRTVQQRPEDTEGTSYAHLTEGGYEEAARKMKAFMESRPPEARVVINHLGRTIYDPTGDGSNCFDNWFWWDAGVDKVIAELQALLDEYTRIGGPDLTAMFWDFEAGCDSSNMSWRYIGVNPTYNEDGSVADSGQLTAAELEERYAAVVADPRYETDIRPGLAALGFTFYEGEDHNELYYYWSSRSNDNYFIGAIFANQRKHAYLNEIYEAVKAYYPNIMYSNYSDYSSIMADIPLELKNASWLQTLPEASERVPSPVGTHSSPVLYGAMPMRTDSATGGKYSALSVEGYAYGDTVAITPFNGALSMLQKMQRVAAYSDEQRVMPWVGSLVWDYSDTIPYACTDYYRELILHLGLCNANAFLYFNNTSRSEPWAQADVVLSDLLDELNELVGYADRKWITDTPISGNARYLLSGMNAGGRNIWRITPDIYTPDGAGSHVSKESFLIDRERPTFRIGNQVVRFPEGSYIHETDNPQGPVGYWVVSPAGTVPEAYTEEGLAAPAAPDYTFIPDAEYEKLKEEMGA